MNKNLFRLCASILLLESVYLILVFKSSLLQAWSITLTLLLLLMIISSIGLWMRKKWSVVVLYIALLISFIVSLMSHRMPALVSGLGDISWFVNLILAIFLTLELKKKNG